MASLHDKLKSLGVNVGVKHLPARQGSSSYSVEKILEGRVIETQAGDAFVVESGYHLDYIHGHVGIQITSPLDVLADWARDCQIKELSPQSFAFIDTETTGLSGGTGTYTFLIGAARFLNNQYQITQFFMRDPIEEPAQLLAFEEFLAPCEAIVSFNGKAFDIPLLNTRYITHGWRSPLKDIPHIDLLHLARRLWRDRIPSRTLSNLETQVLGAMRTEEDIPGWMVPSLYFEYLMDGDARPLKRVFYHNEIDVLSLAALLNYMAELLSDPLVNGNKYSSDLIALARLFEDLGDTDSAANLYLRGLNHEDVQKNRLPQPSIIDAVHRLAMIHKRRENFQAAIELWIQAADKKHIEAHVELAKYYEHRAKEYRQAIFWTQSAIEKISSLQDLGDYPRGIIPSNRMKCLSDLQHRLKRLERKHSLRQE